MALWHAAGLFSCSFFMYNINSKTFFQKPHISFMLFDVMLYCSNPVQKHLKKYTEIFFNLWRLKLLRIVDFTERKEKKERKKKTTKVKT